MRGLFSIFDPRTGLGVNLNWLSLFGVLVLPSSFWVSRRGGVSIINSRLKGLAGEVKLVNFKGVANSVPNVLTGLFVFILVNNFLGLLPYVFTATSHPACTFIVAISSWAGYILYSRAINLSKFLAHLAPGGTPLPLIPFIVLIELVRSCIRPLTLGVRLAANIVAGHLLLVLARQPLPLLST